jgi:hypothetical protein
MSKKPCEVKGCSGEYIRTVLSYANLNLVNTDKYQISIDEYKNLEVKKDYNAVVDEICNVCNDSLNDRLQNFIRNRLSPAVPTEIQEQKKLIEQMYAEGKLVPLSEQEVNELLFNEEADKVLLESALKPHPIDIFIENLDTNLSMFENIEDLYKLLEYDALSLWFNLHYILQKYLEEYVYDVARDGSWVYINDVKYLFDENKKLIRNNHD